MVNVGGGDSTFMRAVGRWGVNGLMPLSCQVRKRCEREEIRMRFPAGAGGDRKSIKRV